MWTHLFVLSHKENPDQGPLCVGRADVQVGAVKKEGDAGGAENLGRKVTIYFMAHTLNIQYTTSAGHIDSPASRSCSI